MLPNSWGWIRPKPEVSNSIQVFHMGGRDPRPYFTASPGHISRKQLVNTSAGQTKLTLWDVSVLCYVANCPTTAQPSTRL